VRLDRPQELEINNRLERPLERPLGGHGRGGRLDAGGGGDPPRPRSCTKAILDEGEGSCRRTGRVCDVTFLGSELQVKGESRYGEAGQGATRWFSENASAIGL
jgi:hypothetical protein